MEKAWENWPEGKNYPLLMDKVPLRLDGDLYAFALYTSTPLGLLHCMVFPEPVYVLIFRGDGIPCGAPSCVQSTITFANPMGKACTPGCT